MGVIWLGHGLLRASEHRYRSGYQRLRASPVFNRTLLPYDGEPFRVRLAYAGVGRVSLHMQGQTLKLDR